MINYLLINKILQKLEFEEKKKTSYYLMSPKEQKAIIEFIKDKANNDDSD